MTSIRQGRCRGSLTGGVLGSRLVAWAIGTCAQTVLRSYSLTNPLTGPATTSSAAVARGWDIAAILGEAALRPAFHDAS